MAPLGAFSYRKATRAHCGARTEGGPLSHTLVYTQTDGDRPRHRGPPGAVCSLLLTLGAAPSPPLQTPIPLPSCGHVSVLSTTLLQLLAPTCAWCFPLKITPQSTSLRQIEGMGFYSRC